MADFYTILRDAIGEAGSQDSDSRHVLYSRARAALQAQIDGLAEPLSGEQRAAQLAQLDEAVRRLEDDYAQVVQRRGAEARPTERQNAERRPSERQPVEQRQPQPRALVASHPRPVTLRPPDQPAQRHGACGQNQVNFHRGK